MEIIRGGEGKLRVEGGVLGRCQGREALASDSLYPEIWVKSLRPDRLSEGGVAESPRGTLFPHPGLVPYAHTPTSNQQEGLNMPCTHSCR